MKIQSTLKMPLLYSLTLAPMLVLGACFKPTSLASKKPSSPETVEQLSNSPILPTETNCADLEKGAQGHSPGPGMNHCRTTPSPESKRKVRELNQMGER